MRYLSVADTAEKWGILGCSVRNYCTKGRVPGAFLTGKTWNIPEGSEKPDRIPRKRVKLVTLLDILRREKESRLSDGTGSVSGCATVFWSRGE